MPKVAPYQANRLLSNQTAQARNWSYYRKPIIATGLAGIGLGAGYAMQKPVLAEEVPKRPPREKVIVMPHKDVLYKRLANIGLTHFMEKTNIIQVLADQEKYPIGVAMAVELAIDDYINYMCKNSPQPQRCPTAILMSMHRSLIYKVLLEDYPEALDELRHQGIYNPNE